MTMNLLVIGLLLMIVSLISTIIKNKMEEMREKSSPFECGFDPEHKMRSAFSLRFFMITLLFLIFDVEASIMLPIPLMVNSANTMTSLMVNMAIMVLLIGSLVIEWTQKTLEWYWSHI